MPKKLSHTDSKGRAQMVDVSAKDSTRREATASGEIHMKPSTLKLITSGAIAKGDVMAAARLAGIMAAKRTTEIIPLCHPIALSSVKVELTPIKSRGLIRIKATAACTGQTGVEMEALVAVSAAALTIYDMCKAVDKEMRITEIVLEEKKGGRSGHFVKGGSRKK